MATHFWIVFPALALLTWGTGAFGTIGSMLPPLPGGKTEIEVREGTTEEKEEEEEEEKEEEKKELEVQMNGWEHIPAPVTLTIPAINVKAAIEARGRTENGDMEVPQDWRNVAWYEPGPAPGERGRAAIAGHLDATDGPAVFWHLEKLVAGDRIFVTDAEGTVRTFRVITAEAIAETTPPEQVFTGSGDRELLLITCDGKWNANVRRYDQRYVVYASLEAPAITPPEGSSSSANTTVRSS